MRLSIAPETPPSWLSTVAFALLVFLILGITGVIYGTLYEDTLTPVFVDAESPPYRRHVAGWFGLVAGFMGATLAGWAWRSSRETHFHITFLSGLVCLIVAAVYVYSAQVAFSRGELMPVAAGADEYWNTWAMLHLMVRGPVTAWFTATLGLVLILSAMIQDRR